MVPPAAVRAAAVNPIPVNSLKRFSASASSLRFADRTGTDDRLDNVIEEGCEELSDQNASSREAEYVLPD